MPDTPRTPIAFSFAVLLALFTPGPSIAQDEQQTFAYDALGRLVAVSTTDGPNNGVTVATDFDKASNRASYSVSGGSNCTFAAAGDGVRTSDYSLYPWLMRTGTCTMPVAFTYNVEKLSGTGQYSATLISTSSPFDPATADTYRYVETTPVAGTVPIGSPLVFRVTWTPTTNGAVITRNSSIMTICNPGGC